jgi:hypothetical protein
MKHAVMRFLKKFFWLVCFVVGLVATLIVFFSFSFQREEMQLYQYVIHITIFIIVLLGISFFPQKFKYGHLLISVPFVLYFGYVCPSMSFAAIFSLVDKYYTLENIFMFPLLVFSICLAYRIGGGTSGKCLKTGLNGLILLFSGFVDVMWFLVNEVDYSSWPVTIPHIEVILGFTPTFVQLLLFVFVHLLLLVIVNILPFDKWIYRLFRPEESA